MRHCIENCPGSDEFGLRGEHGARFPDLRHRYRIRWRDALRALFAPAERLHQMRNLRSAMFYDAIDQLDRPDARSDADRRA